MIPMMYMALIDDENDKKAFEKLYKQYRNKAYLSMYFSVIYLTAAILMLTAFCYISIGDFNYDNVSEITV